MDVRFHDPDLDRLETDASFNANLAVPIVRAFRKVMQVIRAAADERAFHAMRSLKFEKLKGARAHQYSMRLNLQWRLIVEIEPGSSKKTVVVVGIEDYH